MTVGVCLSVSVVVAHAVGTLKWLSRFVTCVRFLPTLQWQPDLPLKPWTGPDSAMLSLLIGLATGLLLVTAHLEFLLMPMMIDSVMCVWPG